MKKSIKGGNNNYSYDNNYFYLPRTDYQIDVNGNFININNFNNNYGNQNIRFIKVGSRFFDRSTGQWYNDDPIFYQTFPRYYDPTFNFWRPDWDDYDYWDDRWDSNNMDWDRFNYNRNYDDDYWYNWDSNNGWDDNYDYDNNWYGGTNKKTKKSKVNK